MRIEIEENKNEQSCHILGYNIPSKPLTMPPGAGRVKATLTTPSGVDGDQKVHVPR